MDVGALPLGKTPTSIEFPIVRHEAACSPVVSTQPWVPPHESTGMCVESNFGVQSSQDNVPSCKDLLSVKTTGGS
jgi:hypothetical protein